MSVAEVSHDAAHRRLPQERICIVSHLWLEPIGQTMTLREDFADCNTMAAQNESLANCCCEVLYLYFPNPER